MKEERFEQVEHTADIAIRVWGHSLGEMFVNAAYGMACQLTDVTQVGLDVEREIRVQAPDVEMLLVEWLSELLYLGEREDVIFVEFEVSTLTPNSLEATALGGAPNERDAHIKAVTFSELDVRRTERGYETVVVFDV